MTQIAVAVLITLLALTAVVVAITGDILHRRQPPPPAPPERPEVP